MRRFLLLSGCLLVLAQAVQAQTPLYFPPTTGTAWATASPQSLGWCQPQLDTVLRYLGRKHTKSFIILKDGRLVVEQYYGTYTRDSLWYWASAGKSLTAALVGIAQQEGLLSLQDSTSRWLGQGWTAAPRAMERLITVRQQLSMTTGLDDTPPPPCDNEAQQPGCLLYHTDGGTRWAYHTGPYRLLQDVLARASGLSINQYTNQRVAGRIGMQGAWVNDVYVSRARDMARFGLLMLNRGTWDQTPVLRDTAYFRRMTTPSQGLNRSYGYLWWLNGQPSHMLPGPQQTVFSGAIIPPAPPDLLAAMGKNEQRIYVVPSLGLVVVRQGNPAGNSRLAVSSFDAELWTRLMAMLQCRPVASLPAAPAPEVAVYPVPASDRLNVQMPRGLPGATLRVTDAMGRTVLEMPVSGTVTQLSVAGVAAGVYGLQVRAADGRVLATRRVVRH